jgi:hypothetical protein
MLYLGRMVFLMLIGLTVVYVSLYFYWRSGIRMRLEEDWVMEGRPGDRDTWVEERLAPRSRAYPAVCWFFSSMSSARRIVGLCLRNQLGVSRKCAGRGSSFSVSSFC